MGVILPETGTRVSVKVDTSNLDKCISSIDKDIFAPVIDIFNEKKSIIEKEVPDELADVVATLISFISFFNIMYHFFLIIYIYKYRK